MKKTLIMLMLFFASFTAQAADFKWMDGQGAIHSLNSLKGKPVLLHLWASWCPPCQSELPEFSKWLNQHPDTQVIPVSVDSSLDDAAAFIKARGLTMPALLTYSEQTSKLGIRGLPTTLIIDADGNIIQRHLGPRDWHDAKFNQYILNALESK